MLTSIKTRINGKELKKRTLSALYIRGKRKHQWQGKEAQREGGAVSFPSVADFPQESTLVINQDHILAEEESFLISQAFLSLSFLITPVN
jgi:hypothetical protein